MGLQVTASGITRTHTKSSLVCEMKNNHSIIIKIFSFQILQVAKTITCQIHPRMDAYE